MLRLINYFNSFITVIITLALIVPYALFESDYHNATMMDVASPVRQEILNSIAQPFNNLAGSISSFIVLVIFAVGFIFLQQWLWYSNVQKHNEYPISEKHLKKYKYVGLINLIAVGSLFFWFFIAWATNFGYNGVNAFEMIKIKRAIFISGIVFSALLSFSSIGFAAYINLVISYEQQIKFVDEMVEAGEYDPVTRKPYENNFAKEIKIEEQTSKDIDINNSNNKDLEMSGSSGLVDNSSNE